jgi:hypothetical protein
MDKAWDQPDGMPSMPPMGAQPAAVAMPNFSAQPAAVAMPNFNAQPVAQQPAAAYVAPAVVEQPVAQPAPVADPARDYYNSLLSQGYPSADAQGYTQQYYPGFQA